MKITQEMFDDKKRASSVLVCPKLTESDKPRDSDMKGICENCNTTIFFCKSSEKSKKKICTDCGNDFMIMDFMSRGKK